MHTEIRTADVLIIGGGTAGCYAALRLAEQAPSLRILIAEKANIRRSGCLAAGVNAINAYLSGDTTPEDYVSFVRWDAEGILREDLVGSMAAEFNDAVRTLEKLGLVILKDEKGNYVTRGQYNIKINGENIKPILAKAVEAHPNITVLNHVNITDYLMDGQRVIGGAGFGVGTDTAWFLRARAVLIATGGAAGVYRPNNPGFSRHKMWYPPFNTGAGYAMGIRAGAEMTSFEMRFVAQRCKDTIAPTGTIALGAGAKEVNRLGQCFEAEYGLSTSGRAYGVAKETHEGRGPCYLQTEGITAQQDQDLLRAYLNMAPSQTLKWVETGKLPSQQNVELAGTEPYLVGGHTASGYWIDRGRRTTLPGLYAAGDVAGGAPKKFVSGALAEGKLAADSILADLEGLSLPQEGVYLPQEAAIQGEYQRRLTPTPSPYTVLQLEEGMQTAMDSYAGGLGANYRYNEAQLQLAEQRIAALEALSQSLTAADSDGLLQIYELLDRLTLCPVVIAHLRARKETRWPGFGVNTDYPEKSPDWEGTLVNSRWHRGQVEILLHNTAEGGMGHEHTHSDGSV
jgi:adenylylsulfate reductase subunit A